MEPPTGKIVAISRGSATVAVARTTACARCAAGKGCGAGLLGSKRPDALLEVSLPEASDLEIGDSVRLALAPANLLRASLLVYGPPLAGIVAVPAAGWLLAGPLSDAAAAGLAVAGFVSGVMTSRSLLERQGCLTRLTPTIEGRADVASA